MGRLSGSTKGSGAGVTVPWEEWASSGHPEEGAGLRNTFQTDTRLRVGEGT